MRIKKVVRNCSFQVVLVALVQMGGCTTERVRPPLPPTIPEFSRVPHPEGPNLGDLEAIFTDPSAPKEADFLKKCDEGFIKLKSLTLSMIELSQGTRELVISDPVSYHWCFYGKLLSLEKEVNSDLFVDEKQKKILSTYDFLVPIAKVFSGEYHDTRYLRWAVTRYMRMSEVVFNRKLELTPRGTSMLVQPENPFGLYRSTEERPSVLEKYHFVQPGVPTVQSLPSETGPSGQPSSGTGLVSPSPSENSSNDPVPIPSPASESNPPPSTSQP